MTRSTLPLVVLTVTVLLTACSTRTETSRLSTDVSEVARQHAVACDLGEAISCYGLAHLYAGNPDERHHGLPYDPASVERLLARACHLDRAFGCDGFRDHQILRETARTASESPEVPRRTDRAANGPALPAALLDRLEPAWAPLVRACDEGTAAEACPRLAWGLTTGATVWSDRVFTTEATDATGGFQMLVQQCDAGAAEACFFASHAQRQGIEPIPANDELAEHLWRHPLAALVQACQDAPDPGNPACRSLVLLLAADEHAFQEPARAPLMQSLCDAHLLAACTLETLRPADRPECAVDDDHPLCVPARIATLRALPSPRDEAQRTLWQEAATACAAAPQEAPDGTASRSPWCQLRDELASGIGEEAGSDACLEAGATLNLPTGVCPGEVPLLRPTPTVRPMP